MDRIYVGLANSIHDTAIAIVDEHGEIVFAEGTERHLQHKRAWNIMPDTTGWAAQLLDRLCDPADIVISSSWSSQAALTLRQNLEGVTQSEMYLSKSKTKTKIPRGLRASLGMMKWTSASQLKALMSPGETLEFEIPQLEGWEDVAISRRAYDHHLTHAVTACFTSGCDEAVCAIVDGVGEGSSVAIYRYEDGQLEEIEMAESKSSTGSLGLFYSAVCEACGFSVTAGEEWKVMGLAAYGKFNPEIYALFREMIGVEGLHIEGASDTQQTAIKRKLEKFRRKKTQPGIAAADLAYAGQQVFEETLFAFLDNLYAKGISQNLVFGGGCALNSSANGKILDRTDFKRLYVFSAPADDGNAIGAALLAHREDHPEPLAPLPFQSPWLGSSMSRETLDHVRRFGGTRQTTLDDAAVAEKAASLLAQGKIIGWIQGRAEFGPRALGNRSILADARMPNIKDLINSRVKFREEFRPFAPSILHEFGPAYFENYQESPYMERTLKFREDVRQQVPGVVHEDLTGRLQTVKREWNQRYYDLIHAFYRLTGTPLIINTSFNVMGKPIAHTVEDVLAVFYTSGLDAVFVDDVLIEK